MRWHQKSECFLSSVPVGLLARTGTRYKYLVVGNGIICQISSDGYAKQVKLASIETVRRVVDPHLDNLFQIKKCSVYIYSSA
jgi:hypothetical protein